MDEQEGEDNMNGEEKFYQNGHELDISILDFWRFMYSNIYNLQEYIAEFLVAKALGKENPDNDKYWTLWDITYREKRIEVKESSYYHSFNEEGKVSKQRTFSISKANSRYEDDAIENTYERQNDIYVFCLNIGENRKEANPLNLDNWEFYIVPTSFINKECGDNKTISIGRIRNMGVQAKLFHEIKAEIDSFIDMM